MDINNLLFFNKEGHNLNFQQDDNGTWIGTVFFEETSIHLFDNENLFIIEKIGSDYKFPALSQGEKIIFRWKNATDSNFMFLYDVTYDSDINGYSIVKAEESIVSYEDVTGQMTGPDVDLSAPLQANIAFNPSEEIEYERALNVIHVDSAGNETVIAIIEFYGEGNDEDERFRIWSQNFGIKLNKTDANILKHYDIKEAFPDWTDVNTMRKSFLVNKEHVFPYIGTYKALSNFINMFGYKDTLSVKEYWKNVNDKSPYFDRLMLVDITDFLDDGKIDNINLLDVNRNIKFGKQFVKTEMLALVYQFTKFSDRYDDDGIPEIVETTEFSVNEIFYKLNLLSDKLKNEIIPINVKIKDIIGEFIYIQKSTIKWWRDEIEVLDYDLNEKIGIKIYPSETETDLKLSSLFPMYRSSNDENDRRSTKLNSGYQNPYENSQLYDKSQIDGISDYIKSYYETVKNEKFPDLSKRLSWEFGDSQDAVLGAPIILELDIDKLTLHDLRGVKLEDIDDPSSPFRYWTLENLDYRNIYEVTWKITKDAPNPYSFEYRGKAVDLNKLPHFLPYAGTYTISLITHEFSGNSSLFTKKVTVTEDLVPEIIAMTRLEDKFDYRISNLDNVMLSDFGSSYLYYPRVNVIGNENTINRFDVYKNLMDWLSHYYNNYGNGRNIYDVEIYDENTQTFIQYFDPSQSHEKIDYWGLGRGEIPLRLSDFKDITIDEMYFKRISDLIYTGDFIAGFYMDVPAQGDIIKISGFSDYVIPSYTNTSDLINILNSETHNGISKFFYEEINGRIHAQARYQSKEMYHFTLDSNTANIDRYTFYLPRGVYSDDTINTLTSIFPNLDPDALFLLAKSSDIFDDSVSSFNYWINEKYWNFDNDEQTGHLPTVIDQNAFDVSNVKLFNDRFSIPENEIAFFFVNNIDGKKDFIWYLYDSINEKEVIRVKGVPFFVWKFKDSGKYSIKVDVIDNVGTVYTNTIADMIHVKSKKDYINHIERKLNDRKIVKFK